MFDWLKKYFKKVEPSKPDYRRKLEILDIAESFKILEEKNTTLLFDEPETEQEEIKEIKDPYSDVVDHIISNIKEEMSRNSKDTRPPNIGLVMIPFDDTYCFKWDFPQTISDLRITPYMQELLSKLDERISFEIGRVDHGIEFRYNFDSVFKDGCEVCTYYINIWYNLNMPNFRHYEKWPKVNGEVEDICKGRTIEVGDKTFDELYAAIR